MMRGQQRIGQLLSLVAITGIALLLTAAVANASGIPIEERETARNEIDARAETAIARAIERYPEVEQLLADSVGWFVGGFSGAQVVWLGGAYGAGVAVDNDDQSRTYLNIRQLDVGAGLGAGRYSTLVVFDDREAFDRMRRGGWIYGLSGQTAAGERGGDISTGSLRYGARVWVMSETGAVVAVTARVMRTRINYDLTDMGVSSVAIPNMGWSEEGEQTENAPRVWPYRLPFLAQKVIDEGYDLPLPYGFGMTYAYVEQEQLLKDLSVGINGNPKEPFDFVSFDNARSRSSNVSVKVDTWLFPFMNVYAMVGHLDGNAPLDVLLDGNGMLEQIGTDCSGIIKPPLCRLLEDRTITLPIDASFSGTNYGVGLVLAGGWKGWFVTIPMNWTYADMDTTTTDGIATTVTPRFGRLFDLGRRGNIAAFVGGNYLDVALEIDGQVSTPGGELVIDYTMFQSNKDEWNGVVGFNWDISRNWAWTLEYNGFFGSRDAWITAVTWRP